MATTGFWPVKGRLKDVINYAENPDKTIERKYLDDDLAATLNYVENSDKTDQTMYVSGINCTKKRAYEQMMTTKRRFGKLGGNVAYHGYQSFQAGEVTPEEAHRIGIETAKRMWGDDYEIVVTTHLNTANLHNHIVLNSVSFRTGRKFENHISDHYKLREISDEVCREYGKSVLKNAPFYGGDKSYWVRKSGRIPHKDMLRHDVDEALANTIKPFDFELYLRSLGYQFVRTFKYQHPSVIAPDWLKPVRLSSLGKDYSREAIVRRLQSQREDKYFVDFYTPKSFYQRQPLIVRIRDFEKRTEPDVITALFDLIITIAKLITGNNVQKRDYRPVSPELRLEIQNLDRTLAEYHFLCNHSVECAEDFVSCRMEIAEQIKAYEAERQHLRNRIRRARSPEEDNSLREQCKEITKKLTPLRKQLIICERIENKVPRLRADVLKNTPRVPLNMKGTALLSGNVFCGHCGARLHLSTANKCYTKADGTKVKKPRIRYVCYGKTRKTTQCDGQSAYIQHKLDTTVEGIVREIFDRIKGVPKSAIINSRYKEELTVRKASLKRAQSDYAKELEKLNKLKAEVVKSIQGESAFSQSMLAGLVEDSEKKSESLKVQCEKAKRDVESSKTLIKDLNDQYDEIISWSSLYDSAPIKAKKMIVNSMIKRVDVYRNYELNVELNMNIRQFFLGMEETENIPITA